MAIKRNETASVSLALGVPAHLFVLLFLLLFFFVVFFFFLSPLPSSSSSFLLLLLRGMARLFSMRQFNDAMRPRLFTVAGEKSPRGKAEKFSRARARLNSPRESAHRRGFHAADAKYISHPGEEEEESDSRKLILLLRDRRAPFVRRKYFGKIAAARETCRGDNYV